MLPDDFGLGPAQTLAHVADPTPPPGFNQFWTAWVARVASVRPGFIDPSADELARAGAPGVTHLVRSTDDIRVGARLTEPEGTVRGAVVALHGYHVEPEEELKVGRGWVERGLAVLDLRVRGYPGSMVDTGDWVSDPDGYITRGIADPWTWSVQGAIADVLCAVRSLRDRYGKGCFVGLQGESFGGGLGIIAASMGRDVASVDRLSIGLPTLGNWAWRERHRAMGGSGGQALRALDEDPERVRATLALFDSVVHARRIARPIVCKLAQRDEVVPAPTAAAVYNALGTGPGLKWCVITETGHADLGALDMAELRRHAMFERISDAFLDPLEDPVALMKKLRASNTEGVA